MATPKKFYHDHFVLILLSTNAFLTCLDIIYILIKLGTSHGSDYYAQYRPSLGVNIYVPGGVIDIISFTVFAVVVMGINSVLSYRVYKIHRQLAIMVLSLGILLLILTLIIGNSLLLLR